MNENVEKKHNESFKFETFAAFFRFGRKKILFIIVRDCM